MVAGIGILSVIVLLPLSFVRSVQATNLTNGTILRFNSESQIKQVTLQQQMLASWQALQPYQVGDAVTIPTLPQIWMKCTAGGTSGAAIPPTWVAGPPTVSIGPPPTVTVDGGVSWTAQEYNSLDLSYVFPVWQPSTAYALGAIVLSPSGANGNNRRFQCTTPGTSGATAPAWNTTIAPVAGTTTDPAPLGPLTWTTVDHSHYVIDPFGWNAMNSVTNTLPSPPAPATLAGALGNNAGGLGANDVANGAAIERFPAGIRSGVTDAAHFAMLPDSWTEQARGAATNPLATSIDLANTDLSSLLLPPSGVSRVVLTDSTGKLSQTRLVTAAPVAAGVTTVQWSAADPLIGGFVPFVARVESQETRYTWMLTVTRSSGGVASVTVTIFFRRALAPADEQVFQVQPGADGFQTPFTVNYPAGQKPFAKKGGFLFDVTDGRWYRITNIVSDTGTALSLLVDQPRPQTDVLLSPSFNVVFMRGVVDVYPIGNE
jgi:hypothetical protein